MQILAQAAQAYHARDYARAATLCQQALQANPFEVNALSLLGFTYLALGQPGDAVLACQQALRGQPDHVDAQNALGIALATQGKWPDAEMSFRHVVRLKPDFSDGYNNLGITLKEQGKHQEAEACYRQALRLKPGSAEAQNNLGNVLKDQGKLTEAEASFLGALRLNPNYAEAHHNLGLALKEQGKLTEAETAYRRAIQLKPNYADAYNNLGNVLNAQGKPPDAESCYQQALRHNPHYADAHSNLGVMLTDQGRFDEAAGHYAEALRANPNYAGAHYNFAMHLLLRGDFARGWREYEWRWRVRGVPPYGRPFTQPLWDGSPLNGRTILLHTEQGLGDSIQFVRYATVAKERGGTVVVQCQPSLVSLLARCPAVDQVVPEGAVLPQFDVQAPLMTLPLVLGTTVETIPSPVPYLSAEPQTVSQWREKWASIPGRKVGSGWRGNPAHRNDRNRSVSLEQFAPLATIEGVRLVSLQKGPVREEFQAFAAQYPILEWDDGKAPGDTPFLDTAAVVAALDLVISVDTAPAHLAGALGVPVWCLLPFIPDWRWLLGRDDSPWYPSMRLFRQERPGDWGGVFERMARELALGT